MELCMLKWIQNFKEASAQTQFYYLNWIIYGLVIIMTTVYCYARLDFVRSYPTGHEVKLPQSPVKLDTKNT
jgi:hypothetical protein